MKCTLRELFLVMALVAMGCGWWKESWRLHGIIDQQSKFWHNERNEYLWEHWKELEALKAKLAGARSKTP